MMVTWDLIVGQMDTLRWLAGTKMPRFIFACFHGFAFSDNSQRTIAEVEECEAEGSSNGGVADEGREEANTGSYMETDAGTSEAVSQASTEDEERTEQQTPRRSNRITRPPERFRS